MSKALDKHKAKLLPLPTADETLALLLRRAENGEPFRVLGSSRETRAALRKALHEKRKREKAENP